MAWASRPQSMHEARSHRCGLPQRPIAGSEARPSWLQVAVLLLGALAPAIAIRAEAGDPAQKRQSCRYAPRAEQLGPLAGALPVDLAVLVLGLTPTPARLLRSADGRSATLWQEGGVYEVVGGGTYETAQLRFFPDGDRFLTMRSMGGLAVWSAWSGVQLSEFLDNGAELSDVQIFPDGRRIACLTKEGRTNIWSAASGELLRSLVPVADRAPNTVRVFPDSERLVTGGSHIPGQVAIIWNATDGAVLHRLTRSWDQVMYLVLSVCGGSLVTGGHRSVVVWDTATGLPRREINRYTISGGVDISQGGATLVRSENTCISVWGSGDADFQPRSELCASRPITALALLPDGRRAVGVTPAEAVVWDVETGERLQLLEKVGFVAQSVAVSPGGDVVAACGGMAVKDLGQQVSTITTKAWEVATGRLIHDAVNEGAQDIELLVPVWKCSVAWAPKGAALKLLHT